MKRVDDFRLRLGKHELVPIMIGGMGVDISTADLALEAARLGGVGHISDAMINTVADRRYDTKHVKEKLAFYKYNVHNEDKSSVKFDLGRLVEATRLHVEATMRRKQGSGLVFINCMEKLTMNAPKETLKVRMSAALDAGIDGITLAAGLHLGSFALIEDHPRFRDAKLGIIVSSVRALSLFLKKSARTGRLPDYVVVEGPLAGGHLGFGMDWAQYDLATIVAEVIAYLKAEQSRHPGDSGRRHLHRQRCRGLSRAGRGGRAGGDALHGHRGVRPAGQDQAGILQGQRGRHRGQRDLADRLSDAHDQGQPGIGDGIRPNCEAYGYLLDANGKCAYVDRLQPRGGRPPGRAQGVGDGQDLPVHPHAQLRHLDLRADRPGA